MKAFTGRFLPLVVALGMGAAACGAGGSGGPGAEPEATSTASVDSPAPPSAAEPTSQADSPGPAESTGSPRVPSATPRDRLVAGSYQPLWPFSGPEEVTAWQRAYRKDGDRAWHLDPRRTAVAFTRDYLGFDEIDQAVKTVKEGRHARVHVGYRSEDVGKRLVAAVVHLVRYGSGDDAPWEVVGTDDTDLTLTTPKYGASVASPLTVGGRITGVDESVRIQVRRPGKQDPVGERCCVSAGGQKSPWSANVSFSTPPGGTLTVVASTGGHVAAVERFAVTGVTLEGSPP
ncbi:hypothetical protein ABZ897_29865 [Nonomuraea sp. NPDC046802]|uniref:hypothetical protein n=1 Tax=Nonomuraea sp. NPDC046802 TaxID=3154919 RepID=UPI0033C53108